MKFILNHVMMKRGDISHCLKKILILNWRDIKNPKCGGGDIITHRIARHLAQMGNDIVLLCSKFSNAKNIEMIDGVKIIRKGSEYILPITGFLFLQNSKEKPDLIIEVINVIPWLVPLYSKINQISFIHQIQTQELKKGRQSSLSMEFNFLGRAVVLFLEKLVPVFYKKNNFVTVSNSIKNDISSLGIDKERIEVIEPGIDKIEVVEQIKKTPNPTILYLGRLKKYKGVHYLLESVSEIRKSIPDVELKIIGKGEYESELRKIVTNYNLESNVKFLGYVSEKEKNVIIQSSWFLVIASLNEGWGIPVIEAGALGIPTVAFANGGLNDSIKNNVTGLLVESENISELTKKITLLIKDDELRNRLGENAKNYSSQFLWSNQLEKWSKIIE